MTVRQAKGCQAHDVIAVMFRRRRRETDCHGTLADLGRAAILLSRASRSLTLLVDAPVVGTPPLRSMNCEWWGVGPSGCADIFPQGIAEAMMQGFYAFERATFIPDDA